MLDGKLSVAGRDRTHRRVAVLVACFVAVFAVAVAGPVSFRDLTTVGSAALAKGKGKGKGLESAPGQAGQQEDDVADVGQPAAADSPFGERAGAAVGGDPAEQAIDETPSDVPPAHITVIKELVGLPDDSALSEQEEMEAIHNGWGTWRTADGPETIIAQ